MNEAVTERMSPIAVGMYTMWCVGLGIALLRVRIDYEVGGVGTLLIGFVGLTVLATVVWFKVLVPWNTLVFNSPTPQEGESR